MKAGKRKLNLCVKVERDGHEHWRQLGTVTLFDNARSAGIVRIDALPVGTWDGTAVLFEPGHGFEGREDPGARPAPLPRGAFPGDGPDDDAGDRG